ncbi:MAG: sulfatase-like hydrolase/transferase [Candidatus Hydrogenedentes bacterium]|nr:sulfatase-like hydrolase/transferase [Candidatus Hydrogenedentota bacterium]
MFLKTDRRVFLKAAAAATAAAAMPGPRAQAAPRRKPNLLFLWTDEQRADTIDVYGNPRIQSPNLSRLASESVVFRNAYVSQPVCTPSRATVMTGLWPHQSGCTQNNVALAQDTRTLPELAAGPDYRTGYFGKWHLGDELFAQHGFEEWRSIEDIYSRYFSEGRDPASTSSYCAWLKNLGHKPDGGRGDFSRDFAARLPLEHCKPKYLEREACDFLRRHRDEPFMLFVNFLEPHMPFTGPLNGLHRPEDVILPTNFDDPIEENEPEAYRERVRKYVTTNYGTGVDLTQESGWRQLIAQYWGLVSQVDRSVGAILTTLEELGLAGDTIVVFTSDHGDMMGSHRMVEKSVMYQEAIRVPWMMRVPEWGRRQHVVEGHVSQIDLVPTLLELLGAPPRDDLPGKSLANVVRGEASLTDPVFVQWNAPEAMAGGRNPGGAIRDASKRQGPSTRAVITQDGWKLCLSDRDRHQVFQLAADPGETTNVFGKSEHRERVERLAQSVRDWQRLVGDPLALPPEI